MEIGHFSYQYPITYINNKIINSILFTYYLQIQDIFACVL